MCCLMFGSGWDSLHKKWVVADCKLFLKMHNSQCTILSLLAEWKDCGTIFEKKFLVFME